MTEKRFTYSPFDGFEDNGKGLSANEVCELLNNLAEENKEFKKQNDDYFKNINNLILDNMIFKNEIIALRKRDEFVRNYVYNNEHMTLEDYNKIVNVLYEELRNKIIE